MALSRSTAPGSTTSPHAPITLALQCLLLLLATGFMAPAQATTTIVLVHGSFTGPAVWDTVTPILKKEGYKVSIVKLYPAGSTPFPPEPSSLLDAAKPIISAINAAPGPVILVGHGISGIYISTAAEACPKKVSKLVYLAAYLLPAGLSVEEQLLATPYTSLAESTYTIKRVNGDGYLVLPRGLLREIFYNRTPAKRAAPAIAQYTNEPGFPYGEKLVVTEDRWGSVDRFYVFTEDDNAVDPKTQKIMVENVGVKESYFIDGSDHTPQLSRPQEFVRTINKIKKA